MAGALAAGGGRTWMRCVVKQALLPKVSAYFKPRSEGALPITTRTLSPGSRIATIASLPVRDSTESLMRPFWR